MQLSTLLEKVTSIPNEIDRDVQNICLDSRQVQAGDLFVAVPGTQVDGRDYIKDAIANGAKVILAESDQEETIKIQNDVVTIPIKGLHNVLGVIAGSLYGNPADHMRMYGVTGTNGKTSITHFIAQCFQQLNSPCGVIGTLGNGIYGSLGQVGLTTPDAITLHEVLGGFVEQGAKVTAMEVSSHSIHQGRVGGINFDVGIFTNLSQDHLDYHGTMHAYAAVKKHFVQDYPIKHLLINVDDLYGRSWIPDLLDHNSVFVYGLQPKGDISTKIPFISAENIRLTLAGVEARILSPWGDGDLKVPLIGKFNLSNILAVLGLLCCQEVPFRKALTLLSNLHAVPGRMQVLGGDGRPMVVVDYSHTPDSLEKALQALKLHAKGKVICVFGCGGDRDQTKRPLMAEVAERWADEVIITNDNPRHEDPQIIADQIVAGLSKPQSAQVELDRSKAIQKSIQCASIDDCILIAGKGAEQYQLIGDTKHPFDDVTHVSRYLELGCAKT